MAVDYARTVWANNPEGGTAINAVRLNNIETGIVDCAREINKMQTPVTGGRTNINVFAVTGALPEDTVKEVPAEERPCLICSRNGSMALYW